MACIRFTPTESVLLSGWFAGCWDPDKLLYLIAMTGRGRDGLLSVYTG